MITLKTNKNLSLQANILEGNQNIVFLSATIATDKDASKQDAINMIIQNKELYEANKVEVRKKISEFQELVWAEQDKMKA